MRTKRSNFHGSLPALAGTGNATLFVNDRPDIAFISWERREFMWGRTDLTVADARNCDWVRTDGSEFQLITKNNFEKRLKTSADYIAVGPVFATKSKENPDPVVGMEFIRRVRGLTTKPIVAIGGITLDRAAEVIEAGADSVAVISDIVRRKSRSQGQNICKC